MTDGQTQTLRLSSWTLLWQCCVILSNSFWLFYRHSISLFTLLTGRHIWPNSHRYTKTMNGMSKSHSALLCVRAQSASLACRRGPWLTCPGLGAMFQIIIIECRCHSRRRERRSDGGGQRWGLGWQVEGNGSAGSPCWTSTQSMARVI